MKRVNKLLAIGLSIVLTAVMFAACSNPADSAKKEEAAAPKKKIALICNGSITDMGWDQSSYEGLMNIAKSLDNVEVSYQENVLPGAAKDVLRNYGNDKYDLIIANNLDYSDIVMEIAPEFPNTWFAVNFGYAAGENIMSIGGTNWQATYLAGVLAGHMSKTGTIGLLTVGENDITKTMLKSFQSGAQTVNKDIKAIVAYTGSWDDVVKGKELVNSMIDQGADVIYSQNGQVNQGAVEAAKERGVKAVGAVVDMVPMAPDTVIGSAISPPENVIKLFVDMFMSGTLKGEVGVYGLKEGVEDISFNENMPEITKEVKDKVAEVKQKIISGEIQKPEI